MQPVRNADDGVKVGGCPVRKAIVLAMLCLVAVTSAVNAVYNFSIGSLSPETNGAITVTWPAWPLWTYHLLSADTLTGNWAEVSGGRMTAGSNVFSLSYTDVEAGAVSQRFYKVRIHYTQLVMTLVLDRSGSMLSDGGAQALAPAVTNFIALFDDSVDKVAMVGFASAGSTDVTMRTPFKSAVQAAALALTYNGNTCTEQGLLKAWQQNQSVLVTPGTETLRVIVFFTDGLANTFNYTFNCGARNISNPSGAVSLYDPTTGNAVSQGCTIPSTIVSVDGTDTVSTASCIQMHAEAERRALAIAKQARQDGTIVFVVGLGSSVYTECGLPALNPYFLQALANDASGPSYDPTQPAGRALFAASPNDLLVLLQQIATQIHSY
jgi:hypothetical protein